MERSSVFKIPSGGDGDCETVKKWRNAEKPKAAAWENGCFSVRHIRDYGNWEVTIIGW